MNPKKNAVCHNQREGERGREGRRVGEREGGREGEGERGRGGERLTNSRVEKATSED